MFALSLTRFAYRNPNGITYGYATFDLLLQNSSITKRCFVISTKGRRVVEGFARKNLMRYSAYARYHNIGFHFFITALNTNQMCLHIVGNTP